MHGTKAGLRELRTRRVMPADRRAEGDTAGWLNDCRGVETNQRTTVPDCSLIESGACEWAFNMALDETLLEAMPELRRPVLRFYGWIQKAASFGYFQRFSQIEALTALRPLVRRPTGGGLVQHDSDWTYSLAFPVGDPWYELRAKESYQRVHQWLLAAFGGMGVATALAARGRKEAAGQCFAGHEQFDLLCGGGEGRGAAEQRGSERVLLHGCAGR